jgi:hypothetical protein
MISACTKDGAKLVVVSPHTSKYNGKYVGNWSSYYSSPISSSSTNTPGYSVDIMSGYDETHNVTSISTCTYVQFDNSGYYITPNKYGTLIVRNDSLIYSEYFKGGVGNGTSVNFKGKRQ